MSKTEEIKAGTSVRSFKPYSVYKDSGVEWLGRVPQQWDLKKLKHVLKCLDGKRVPLNSEQRGEMQGEYPYWGANGIVDYVDNWIFDEDLVLLGEDGAPFFERFKDVAFFVSGKIWVNNHAHVLRSVNGADPIFLKHVLNVVEYRAFIFGTTRDKLTQDDMNSIPVQLPAYNEQRAIAAFLDRETDRIEQLMAKKERQIELLQEKRSALISYAVTKGLNPKAKMKNSGIEWLGEIPEHWEVSKLGFHSIVKARLGWKGLKAEEYVDSGYIFLATPNIKGKRIDFINVNYITETRYAESPEIMLMKGDVLLAKDGSTLGTVNVIRELPAPATVNSSVAVVRPKENVNSLYLYYLIASDYTQKLIEKMKGGQGVPHLFQDDIRKFWIWIPPLAEQQAIAAHLDFAIEKTDALILKVESSIDKLREYRTALICAAVTGKIDVREEAA